MSLRRDRIRTATVALALILLATVFWALFWHQTADSVLTRVPLLDESWYLREAARLQEQGLPGDDPFVMSPGYPMLVAAGGGRAPGEDQLLATHPYGLLALQAVLWLACGLIAGCTVTAAGRRAGLGRGSTFAAGALACGLFLLYRPAAIYARTILLEIPLTALVVAALGVLAAGRTHLVIRVVLAGALLGAAAILRGHVLVLVPLLLAPVAVWPVRRRVRTLAAGLLVVLALLPVGLASWHNSVLARRFAGPSLNAGLNLYLGQIPAARGLFTPLAGFDFEHDPSGETYLEARMGRPLDGPAEADAAWFDEAGRIIAAAPGRAVVGWLHKCWLHLQGWEIAQVTPLGAWPEEAPVLRALPVTWSVLVSAGLMGLLLALAVRVSTSVPRRQVVFWVAAVGLLVGAQSVFFVVSRYRLVLAPLLAVLAGHGVLTVLAALRDGRRRALVMPLFALPLVVAATVPWGLGETRAQWRGQEAYNLVNRLLAKAAVTDDPDLRTRADVLLEQTCEAVPRRVDPWRRRVRNLAQLGQPVRALQVASQGIMTVDDSAPLESLRIGLVREAGRLDEAEALMQAYLREHPGSLDMLHDLAVLQGRRGRWRAAEATGRNLQSRAPADPRGWLDVGMALVRQGRSVEAADVIREGMRRVPAGPARDLLETNLKRLEADGGAPR